MRIENPSHIKPISTQRRIMRQTQQKGAASLQLACNMREREREVEGEREEPNILLPDQTNVS